MELTRIMRSYTYEKLLWTTSRVLKGESRLPSDSGVRQPRVEAQHSSISRSL